MIVKKREFPFEIQQLQAIARRLNPLNKNHSYIQEKLAMSLAGYKGELALNYPLTFLPANDLIFHNLRLNDEHHFFQIDTLVMTAKWILIIEAKYIAGQLHYDQHHQQLKRTLNHEVQGFDDPVTQVQRHRRQLQKWFTLHELPIVPIFCLVANSHPHCVLSSDDPHLDTMIRTYNLPEKIAEIDTSQPKPILSESQLQLISSTLLKDHTLRRFDYLSYMDIAKKELQYGVFCAECGQLPISRKHGSWMCHKCGHSDKEAHVSALKDYYLLFGAEITNAKLRRFLGIDSTATAQRMLKSLNTERRGLNKGTIYRLIFDE